MKIHKKITALGVTIALGFTATAIIGVPTSFARPIACAAGGPCRVGDTGPGGGIIYYVDSSVGGFACGPNGGDSCNYLEVSPTGWSLRAIETESISWATNVNSNQSTEVYGADSRSIGSGHSNSIDIASQSGNVAGSSAAVAARDYSGGSKTDWYLPSKDELNELCKYVKGQRLGDPTVPCAPSRKIKSGFLRDNYWSSSEYVADNAWSQNFSNGTQNYDNKLNTLYVRPVRAF